MNLAPLSYLVRNMAIGAALASAMAIASLGMRIALALGRLLIRLGYDPLSERCSWCRRDLPVGEAFYIDGRRVCAVCAEKGRHRMIRAAWGYVVLTCVLALGAGYGTWRTIQRADPDAWLAIPIVVLSSLSPLAMLWLIMKVMKASNRSAHRNEEMVALLKEAKALQSRLKAHDESLGE